MVLKTVSRGLAVSWSSGARRSLWAGAAGLLFAAVPLCGQELNGRAQSIVASAKIGTAKVGISAIDLATGRPLIAIDADSGYIPASNMKVLTTGAALKVLGEDFVFRTELILAPDSTAETGATLILKGSGDPALGDPAVLDRMSPKMSINGLMEALAGSVKSAGIERVSTIIVDDRIFDREYIHTSWPTDQLDRWYCAPVAGLNFNTNVVSFFPAPGAEGPGSPPTWTMEPDAWWLEVENRAQTSASGNNSVWFARAPGSNRFTMFGQVRLASRVPIHITAHEIPVLVGQLLAAELPRIGIPVAGSPKGNTEPRTFSRAQLQAMLGSVRFAAPDEQLSGRKIAVITTHIRDILDRCNGDSQNMYAEALIKRLGHEVTGQPGSWTNGASVLRMTMADLLGPQHAASTVIADGSGMSRDNRVAPGTLAAWLARMAAEPSFADLYINSMATPGDGTLRRRFGNVDLRNALHAKSGKINGVRCLSGYLTSASGRRIAFSIMVNDLREGENALNSLKLHEELVVALDSWLSAQRPAAAASVPSGQ